MSAPIYNKYVVTKKTIQQILSAFLRCYQLNALQETHKMMQSKQFDMLSPDIPMYDWDPGERYNGTHERSSDYYDLYTSLL